MIEGENSSRRVSAREVSIGHIGKDSERGIIRETTDVNPFPSPSAEKNIIKDFTGKTESNVTVPTDKSDHSKNLIIKNSSEKSSTSETKVFKEINQSANIGNIEKKEKPVENEIGKEQGEVLDPKSKPIVAIHASHDKDDVGNLIIMDKEIRAQIANTQKSHPEKKVAVVLEHAEGPKAFSDRVRALVADEKNPMLPTDALVQAVLEEHFPDGVPETADQERRIIRDSINTYTTHTLTRLDRIAYDHPGKLEVVLEAHDPALLKKVKDPITIQMFGVLKSYNGANGEDLKPDDIYLHKAAVSILAGINHSRDVDKAKQIETLVEKDSIAAVVNIEGPIHRSGEILKENGYAVTQDFPEQGCDYRSMDFVREVMANPGRLTDDNIRQVVTEQTKQFSIEPGDSKDIIKRKVDEKIREGRKQSGLEPVRLASLEQYTTAKQVLEKTLSTQPKEATDIKTILNQINTQTLEGEQYARDIWRITKTAATLKTKLGRAITAKDLDSYYLTVGEKAATEGKAIKAQGIARRRELVSKIYINDNEDIIEEGKDLL